MKNSNAAIILALQAYINKKRGRGPIVATVKGPMTQANTRAANLKAKIANLKNLTNNAAIGAAITRLRNNNPNARWANVNGGGLAPNQVKVLNGLKAGAGRRQAAAGNWQQTANNFGTGNMFSNLKAKIANLKNLTNNAAIGAAITRLRNNNPNAKWANVNAAGLSPNQVKVLNGLKAGASRRQAAAENTNNLGTAGLFPQQQAPAAQQNSDNSKINTAIRNKNFGTLNTVNLITKAANKVKNSNAAVKNAYVNYVTRQIGTYNSNENKRKLKAARNLVKPPGGAASQTPQIPSNENLGTSNLFKQGN